MLPGELVAVVQAGFQVPALVGVGGFAVGLRGVAAGHDEEVGLVEIRVGHAQAGAVLPGGVFDGLFHGAAAGVLLGDGHVRVIAALDAGAEAFGNEVQTLRQGHVHVQAGLVFFGPAEAVIVFETVPAGQAVRDGVLGYLGDGHAVDDARRREVLGPEHGTHPDVGRRGIRLAGIADDPADVELHVRGLGELEVQVRAVVIAVVGVVVVVVQARHLLEQTVLEHVAHRHEVADLVGTAGDVDVVLGLQEHLAEHQFAPVGVREHQRVRSRAVRLDGFLGEIGRRVRVGVVPHEYVIVFRVFVAVGLADVGQRYLDAGDGTYVDLRFAGLAALGGDDDDAVRAAYAEHRRGGGVFQDGKAFDFIRVDRVHRTLDAIHEDERGGGGFGEGADASDIDLGVVFARLAAELDGGDARHLAGQDVGHVSDRRLDERLGVDGRKGARDCRLGLRTIRHDHGRFDGLRVFPHDDRQVALRPDLDLLGDIAQGGNFQYSRLAGDGDLEETVHAGGHAGRRPLQGHACADDRKAFGVDDGALDENGAVLCEQTRAHAQEQETDSSQSCQMDCFLFHKLYINR